MLFKKLYLKNAEEPVDIRVEDGKFAAIAPELTPLPGEEVVEDCQGKRIVVIRVPRASRRDRPVYVGGDPLTGTYRRSGEGDFRCTPDEVRRMFRRAGRPLP